MRIKTISKILISIFLMIASETFADQIKLILDLEIKEPDNIIFNNLKDIATDSKNNIYVLDKKEKTIYLFNEEGIFLKKIGNPGQGPGEFEMPCSIYLDTKDIIYVLDETNRRIETFDSDSNYIKSIQILKLPTGNRKSIVVDKKGDFYISGYYRNLNAVICKFSATGEFMKQFPFPAIEYKGIDFNDRNKIMVMQYLCGGSMCFDDNENIFFSYAWPYLMKKLTKEGDELFQLSRENSFNWTPFIFKTDRINGMLSGESTRTHKMFFLNNNYLVNSIYVVDWEGNPKREIKMSDFTNNPEKYIKMKRKFAVLDFYTLEGEFIESTEIDEKIYFLTSDRKGRVLGIKLDAENFQSLVRYKVEINRD